MALKFVLVRGSYTRLLLFMFIIFIVRIDNFLVYVRTTANRLSSAELEIKRVSLARLAITQRVVKWDQILNRFRGWTRTCV
jgi:hypothetical protein